MKKGAPADRVKGNAKPSKSRWASAVLIFLFLFLFSFLFLFLNLLSCAASSQAADLMAKTDFSSFSSFSSFGSDEPVSLPRPFFFLRALPPSVSLLTRRIPQQFFAVHRQSQIKRGVWPLSDFLLLMSFLPFNLRRISTLSCP